ncbi:17872_t:CDS:2, partial [Gigaspora rosea]
VLKKLFKSLLDHERMQTNTNEGLRLAPPVSSECIHCNLSRRDDGGLYLTFNHEKNNQRGALKSNKYGKSSARKIPIPPDDANNRFKPIQDILQMISLRPFGAFEHDDGENSGTNLDNGRKISNHSLRRTAIQRLKDPKVPEDERMEFSGHRSREGIQAYSSAIQR